MIEHLPLSVEFEAKTLKVNKVNKALTNQIEHKILDPRLEIEFLVHTDIIVSFLLTEMSNGEKTAWLARCLKD